MKILIVSHDPLGERMAGPAIRYWEMAGALSKEFEVLLAAPGQPTLKSADFRLEGYEPDGQALAHLAKQADVILVSGYLLHKFPLLKSTGKPLVVDIYDPFILENLEIHSVRPLPEQAGIHTVNLKVLNELLQTGDFFSCASEKQRDYWLGMLAAVGRINPYTYNDDRRLRRLVDVVSFGLPGRAPGHEKQVLKGVWEGIDRDDKVILWGGGIWEWFDPLTLIKAMARMVEKRGDVKLFFMGMRHPNVEDVPEMRMCAKAVQLSEDLGLFGKHIFFNDWVPYQERENYLLEGDIGVSLHFDYIETRFSFRTRLLDYIWAGLPMVVTKGDALGDLVERHGLGRTVDYEDVQQVEQSLWALLNEPDLRAGRREEFERVAAQLTWAKVVEPLARFCRQPSRAPDAPFPGGQRTSLLALARHSWEEGGIRGLWAKARTYLGRR